jgi:hypothetical protein
VSHGCGLDSQWLVPAFHVLRYDAKHFPGTVFAQPSEI